MFNAIILPQQFPKCWESRMGICRVVWNQKEDPKGTKTSIYSIWSESGMNWLQKPTWWLFCIIGFAATFPFVLSLMRLSFIFVYLWLKNFDIYNGGKPAEAALLNNVSSIPDGSIVLMAVFDAARPCGTDYRSSLDLVGVTPQAIARRGRKEILTYIHFDHSSFRN